MPIKPLSEEKAAHRRELEDEYRTLCAEEPNAVRRLGICLRGHDIHWLLVRPIHDALSVLADVVDDYQSRKEDMR